MRLPFRAALAGDIFQIKIYDSFKEPSKVFNIIDDLLIIEYDKTVHITIQH